MKRVNLFFCSLMLFLLFGVGYAKETTGEEKNDLNTVEKIVHHYYPTARIITHKDTVITQYCGSHLEHPGYVKGDFTGEGKTDFAVLLNRGSDNFLVVLLGDPLEGSKPIILDKEAGDIIELVKKGEKIDANEELLGEQKGNHVVLINPAIESIFCEKSSKIYYWDTKQRKFVTIWTGD